MLTTIASNGHMLRCMQPTRIHENKKPKGLHYIAEWAEKYGKTPGDFIKATGADKSLVSRWLSGTLPGEQYLDQIGGMFDVGRESLFMHPDNDWLAKFFRDRTEEEQRRARVILEQAFPKTGSKS